MLHRLSRAPNMQQMQKCTCSLLLFLAAHFPLFPAVLLLAGSLLSALPSDGDTDVMIVGWTIHCRSGVLEIAVTVGTNEPGDSASTHEPCNCDENICHSRYIRTTLIYVRLHNQVLKCEFLIQRCDLSSFFFLVHT